MAQTKLSISKRRRAVQEAEERFKDKQTNRRQAVERFLGILTSTRQFMLDDHGSDVSEFLQDIEKDRLDLTDSIDRIEASLRARMTSFEALENAVWF